MRECVSVRVCVIIVSTILQLVGLISSFIVLMVILFLGGLFATLPSVRKSTLFLSSFTLS